MAAVLNATLYNALKRRFGDVLVSNAGTTASVSYSRRGDRDCVNVKGGEYYRVDCPNCGDTSKHLWVSYLFGTYDSRSNSRLYHVATCYKCPKRQRHRRNDRDGFGIKHAWDADWIEDFKETFSKARHVAPRVIVTNDTPLTSVNLPRGAYSTLDQLPCTHPAVAYLASRGYDHKELSNSGWMYCATSKEVFASKRIIIPILHYIDDCLSLVGFQTRAIPGFSTYETPKYWTMAGFQRSRTLYNFHIAKDYPLIVVVEGVTDAARVGPNAVALLGKSLSVQQLKLLVQNSKTTRVAVLLDNDAYASACAMADMLRTGSVGGSHLADGAFIVSLPRGGDPGDYTREELTRFIGQAGDAAAKKERSKNDSTFGAA